MPIRIRTFCLALIFVGAAMRFYHLNDPWKQNDHYNFGGVHVTNYLECMKSIPLSQSKGIVYGRCGTPQVFSYPNHPPTIIFGLWAWTSMMGSTDEWALRSFFLIFSLLNIVMIFLIAREVKAGDFAYLAAACQSCFLGNMYFGTHLDFIGEFVVFFILVGAWLALRRRMTLASLLGLAAGLAAWPGYIFFGPLWVYAFMIRKGRKRVFAFGVLGAAIALATMMWLQQRTDVIGFLIYKIFTPHYLKPEAKGWTEWPHFFLNFVSSQGRLLSGLLAGIALFELCLNEAPDYFKRRKFFELSRLQHAILLTGGTGIFYALLSHEYFIIHVFLYLLFTPALALCAARFLERSFHGEVPALSKRRKWILCCSILLFTAFYPFGIFQSSRVLDTSAAILMISSSLIFIYGVLRTKLAPTLIQIALAVCVLGNVLELINYRNEPDRDRSFCRQARIEYERTKMPVRTTEPWSEAKDILYCRGIPIEYSEKH